MTLGVLETHTVWGRLPGHAAFEVYRALCSDVPWWHVIHFSLCLQVLNVFLNKSPPHPSPTVTLLDSASYIGICNLLIKLFSLLLSV